MKWNERKNNNNAKFWNSTIRIDRTEKQCVDFRVNISSTFFYGLDFVFNECVIVLQSPLNYSHPSTFRRTNVHAFEHTNSTVCFSATPWFFFLVTKEDEKSVYIFSINIYVHYLISCHTVSHSHNQTGHKQEQMKRNERTNGMNEKKKQKYFETTHRIDCVNIYQNVFTLMSRTSFEISIEITNIKFTDFLTISFFSALLSFLYNILLLFFF